jgi:hypothetical protein
MPSVLRHRTSTTQASYLVHLAHKLVDVILPVTKVTTQYVMLEFTLSPSACWVGQLEGPEEIRCLEWERENIYN